MSPWVTLALLACGRKSEPDAGEVPKLPDAPAAQPVLDLGPGGAPVIRLLDRLSDAVLDLPQSSLPDVAQGGGTWDVTDGWVQAPAVARRGGSLWRRDSPVDLPQKRYTAAPPGMRLMKGEAELPFQVGLFRGHRAGVSWDVRDDTLFVSSRRSPSAWPERLVLTYEIAAKGEDRLNLGRSGLAPAEFARHSAAIDGLTREAMLVPAPGSARFRVEIPSGARLRFGAALAEAPGRTDTASAVVAVEIDGTRAWASGVRTGEPWTQATVDLAQFAGRTVEIAFVSEPAGDPERDYAVFASPEVVGAPSATGPRRIVVVGIDTLRADHLGVYGYERPTSPGMDAIAAQSVVFDRAWAPAPRTRPSFRTSTTGRWPLAAINARTLGEVLGDEGFSTAGIVANVHLAPRLGFADGYDWWEYENSALGETQVDRALGWLGEHRDEDSFLFLHLMDPHVFYTAPEPFLNRFVQGEAPENIPDKFNRWMVLQWDSNGRLGPRGRKFIEARYDGEIAYTDRQVARFVAALDELPGKTLLVVHSDHGEEFWEHGSYEHNHSLYQELVHAALWIRPPGGWGGGPHRVPAPVSLADLAPTLYDAVGVPPERRPGLDGVSLAPFVDAARSAEGAALAASLDQRPLPLGHLMFDSERWGVVWRGGKYVLHTMSGDEELYDLSMDPGEHTNVAAERPVELAQWRERLGSATGWPVGTGWRLKLMGLKAPLAIEFQTDVFEAGVIDPEAGRQRRANLEWGEVPEKLPEEVGTVTIGADHRTVTITPGPEPRGTIYVLGPTQDTLADAVRDGTRTPFGPGLNALPQGQVRVSVGGIIVPKDSEAARLAEEHDPDAIEALRALGYVE